MVELSINLPSELLAKIGRFLSHPLADIFRDSHEDVSARMEDMMVGITSFMGDRYDPFSDPPTYVGRMGMGLDHEGSYAECFFWLKAADEWQQEMEDEYASQ